MCHAQGPGNTMHINQRVCVDVIIWKNFEIELLWVTRMSLIQAQGFLNGEEGSRGVQVRDGES